jgi:hypothetical protein
MFRTLFIFFSLLMISCGGSRDLTRGDGEGGAPDPLSGLQPDLFILFSKNTDSIDLTLRQVSEDLSEIFFTDVRINLQTNRVSFENESVGDLDCQSMPSSTVCNLIFYTGVTGSFALSFQEDYDLRVEFESVEAYEFDDAPPVFSADTCEPSYGTPVPGEKITVTVVEKEEQSDLVTFFFYDFGFENQGQLPTLEGADRTTLYYGVNFDSLFSGVPYTFSGVRKNTASNGSFLEIQAIQTSPVFKRSLVCFND